MRIVLDTNCLLVSVQEYSEYYWIWKAFCDKKYTLFYTDEILNEYQEVLTRYYSPLFAKYTVDAILNANNAKPVTVYYKWYLIVDDPDDNKFADCAVTAGADYLVTNDKHFKITKKVVFPKIKVIDIDTFMKILFADNNTF